MKTYSNWKRQGTFGAQKQKICYPRTSDRREEGKRPTIFTGKTKKFRQKVVRNYFQMANKAVDRGEKGIQRFYK